MYGRPRNKNTQLMDEGKTVHYVKSARELEHLYGIPHSTAYKLFAHPQCPKPLRGKGYPAVEVLELAKRIQAEQAAKKTGNALKDEQIRKRIELLEVQIAGAKREDELKKIEHEAKRREWIHRDDMAEQARMVIAALDRIVAAVGQITRDVSIEQQVKEMINGERRLMAQWCREH